MGLVENIKTYMEQSSERKLFSKKLGVKACCVEAGIYDKKFLQETELTAETYAKILDMYIDEIVNKFENNNYKKRQFFKKVGQNSADLVKGLSREELKEKIVEEMNLILQGGKVNWQEKSAMFRTVFNEIKVWIIVYGIDRLFEDNENVRMEMKLGIDQKRYEAIESKGKKEVDEEEVRKEVHIAQTLSDQEFENYKNIDLLKSRFQSLLLTSVDDETKKEIEEKIQAIDKMSTMDTNEIGEALKDLYFDYEVINRSALLGSLYVPKNNTVINREDELCNMLVHFFDDSRSLKRFNDIYRSKIVKRIKHRTGKKDEKDFTEYEKQDIESAMKDYEEVKMDTSIINNSANVALNASCGFDYSVKSNVSNQISASVVKKDILLQRGISVGIGLDSRGVPLENIATISDTNIYSNQGLENIPTENEFRAFSSSALDMMSDDKRRNGRNEVVMFRNTDEASIKPSYFLCVCNKDIENDEESTKLVEEYRAFAESRSLPFVFVDAYEINKAKVRQKNQEIDLDR